MATSEESAASSGKTKPYKWCFVPNCTNTTIKTPEKIFLTVPKRADVRKKWAAMARRDNYGASSTMYCCEDHFNLQEDAENWLRYRMLGGNIILKPGVVPHKFDCQAASRKTVSSNLTELILSNMPGNSEHEYVTPLVPDHCSYKTMVKEEADAITLNTFSDQSHIVKKEVTSTSQEDVPVTALDNVLPCDLLCEVKIEPISEDEQDCEQERTEDQPCNTAIKKDVTEDDKEDRVLQTKISDKEYSGTQANVSTFCKTTFLDDDIVKSENNNVLNTYISEKDSMSDTSEEVNKQQHCRRKKQIFQKDIKALCNTDETGYTCYVCGKVFSKSQICLKHIWHTHSGEKLPYTCKLCGKVFKSKHNLNCHELCHSNASAL